jgi:signal transduction histidine kinase
LNIRGLRCEGVPRYDDAERFLGYTFCAVDVTLARLTADELEERVQARTAELSHTLDQLQTQILERERAEGLLRQSQKMEAVGQLTGGLAHDFNNLLTGITGSLSLLRTRVAQGRYDSLDRYLDAAQGASDRAASLTHRLLAFSRQQNLAPAAVDANSLVSGLEEMVRRTAGPAISLETAYATDLWTTLCDPHQLENAVLNLCINARDAMPDGGQLLIETANSHLEDTVAAETDLAPGDYVEVRVSDTGVGMSPEIMARVFEPFFTTKPLGQGTGLGLSMTYGFVRQTGGQVRIHSIVDVGTTMQLYLPRFTGVVEPTARPKLPLTLGKTRSGGDDSCR